MATNSFPKMPFSPYLYCDLGVIWHVHGFLGRKIGLWYFIHFHFPYICSLWASHMVRFKALRPRRTTSRCLKMRQIFWKIKITLFLSKNIKFRRGNPPELVANSKIVIEINLVEGCFTSPRTMTGLSEVSKYPPEVVLPSTWYIQCHSDE